MVLSSDFIAHLGGGGLCKAAAKTHKISLSHAITEAPGTPRSPTTLAHCATCRGIGTGGFASKLKRVSVPRVSMSGAPSQTATLTEFAQTLTQGQL